MITTIAHQSGATPVQVLADAEYCSDANVTAIGETTIDAYISTRKQKHGERPGPCPRGPLPRPHLALPSGSTSGLVNVPIPVGLPA